MNKYSKTSTNNLSTCHNDLQLLFRRVLEIIDHTIIIGHRNEEEQTQAFRVRNSTKQWPNSKHNNKPSWAVDVAPYPIDWKNLKRFYYFAGVVQTVADEIGIKVRWGGDWDGDLDFDDQTLYDLVHWELING